MILADTSVWIEHLRRGDRRLGAALEAGRVLMHPFVIGELACGNIRQRRVILDLLASLPAAPMASEAEAHALVEQRKLHGRGIGWIDVHLLASTAIAAPARLWTLDKRLDAVAAELELRAS